MSDGDEKSSVRVRTDPGTAAASGATGSDEERRTAFQAVQRTPASASSSSHPANRKSEGVPNESGIELAPVNPDQSQPTSSQPARAASPDDALSLDEEEEIKLEAQIGMLLTAASKNNVKRIRGLINAGVPPSSSDYDQRTALHLACSEGHLEAAQLLVDEGADANAKDRFGSTPLDDATRGNHHDLVVFLKAKKAVHGGLGKLQAKLIEHCAKNEMKEIQMLLPKDVNGEPVHGSAGISPNCQDYDRRTPLHLAVAEGHLDLVQLLLVNGADPHAVDRWGLTPIAEAARKAARVGSDPIVSLFREGGFMEGEEESVWSFFSVFFGFWEVAMMILFGLFCKYDERTNGDNSLANYSNTSTPLDTAAGNEFQAEFSRVYPLFQDVHVMIFIGFGFLMVFLRKHGYTSVGMTFLIGAFVLQWYQLCEGFWSSAFSGDWHKIPLKVEKMVMGDFCAGSVLITFGVLLGKVNPSQILFIAIIETIFYSLNERIGFQMGAADLGGTMTIHMFGAFFGYGASWMMTPKEAYGHENNAANYHSDIMAMIGTVFLWMYWPSFNGALGSAQVQERAVINTVLSLCGSCVVAFIASHVLRRERRFNMVDIQNATLAGGVAMGACCTMIILPGSAIGIGGAAGLVSVLGYVYVQPFLERKLGLHDTCGVNNLHGMPSIIGGFAAVIAASYAELDGIGNADGYGPQQLGWVFPERTGLARTAYKQAAIQFAYMITSIFIGLVSGSMAGHFAITHAFDPTEPKSMYIDHEYWEVPQLETPYYFDHRGEISRDALTVVDTNIETETEEGAEISKVEGANLDAPDNARLLSLIQSLETRLNQLTRRVGQQPGPSITGVSSIPQAHITKSAVSDAEYPASTLAAADPATIAAPPAAALDQVVVTEEEN